MRILNDLKRKALDLIERSEQMDIDDRRILLEYTKLLIQNGTENPYRLQPGDLVFHEKLGPGTVTEVLPDSWALNESVSSVQFTSGEWRRSIPVKALEFLYRPKWEVRGE